MLKSEQIAQCDLYHLFPSTWSMAWSTDYCVIIVAAAVYNYIIILSVCFSLLLLIVCVYIVGCVFVESFNKCHCYDCSIIMFYQSVCMCVYIYVHRYRRHLNCISVTKLINFFLSFCVFFLSCSFIRI